MHKDIRRVVGDDMLDSLISYFDSIFHMNDYEFSIELTNKIMKIVKVKKNINSFCNMTH